jgi:hypothetical protein
LFNQLQQLGAVAGLADYRVAGYVHDQGSHAGPDKRVVIHEK